MMNPAATSFLDGRIIDGLTQYHQMQTVPREVTLKLPVQTAEEGPHHAYSTTLRERTAVVLQ